jgi:hypothetical protein
LIFSFERLEEEEEHHVEEAEVEEEAALLHKIINLKKNQFWIFQNTWIRKYASNSMEGVKVFDNSIFTKKISISFLTIRYFLNYNSNRIIKRT